MTCDICGKDRDTEDATVTIRGRTWRLALCEDDAGPLAELAEKGSQGPRKGPVTRVTKPETHRVEPIA